MTCKGEGVTHFACDCQLKLISDLNRDLVSLNEQNARLKAALEVAKETLAELSIGYGRIGHRSTGEFSMDELIIRASDAVIEIEKIMGGEK